MEIVAVNLGYLREQMLGEAQLLLLKEGSALVMMPLLGSILKTRSDMDTPKDLLGPLLRGAGHAGFFCLVVGPRLACCAL